MELEEIKICDGKSSEKLLRFEWLSLHMGRSFEEWWSTAPLELKQKARKGDEGNKPLLNQINYVLLHLHLSGKHDLKPTHEELKDLVAEALEEHQEVKILLEELEELGSESHDFGSKLQELIESVEHHVEEEEGEMFPKVREVFDESQLEQLGQELESAKGTAHRKAG